MKIRCSFTYIWLVFPLCIYIIIFGGKFNRQLEESKSSAVADDQKDAKENYSNTEREYQEDNMKTILLWTNFFYSRDVWNSIFIRIITKQCEENRCRVTLDRNEIETSHAVLFNAFNLRNVQHVPKYLKGHVYPNPEKHSRSPDQIYIFYSMEPPIKLDKRYMETIPNNYFNWTMGYRLDSDVVEPYGIVRKKSPLIPRNTVRYITQEELKQKKLACWMASSCYKYVPFVRERFVEAIRKHIKIDIFGHCGIRCDTQTGIAMFNKTIGTSPCERMAQDHRFYLTLENSLCKDYISEKIFRAWNLGIIPVVFGEGNYSAFAPPNSYIDFRDFKSVAELIKYMKKVGRDAKLYNQYFKWKEDYDVIVGNPYDPFVCDLCKKLHIQAKTRISKSYANISDWFITKGQCRNSLDGLIDLN